MRPSLLLTGLALLTVAAPAVAKVDAKLMRYPAVSATQIAFTYAGDIWVVPKTGGVAQRLSTPPGEEAFARFSPDGRQIAFSAGYDGAMNVYTMPVSGGTPTRVTSHPIGERLVGWNPDGKTLLFASRMTSGRDRFNQLFRIPAVGGMPEALPLPYGEFGSLAPDGRTLAFVPISTDFRTWKRYRGGMASEIWFYDLKTGTSERLAQAGGSNDSLPMWHGSRLYFLSDRDATMRANIWSYDRATKAFKQITFFKDADVHFPSIGPSDIVLEANGRIYRVELPSEKLVEVPIEVMTDQSALRPRQVNAGSLIQSAGLSPQGKRVVVEARGELFSLPAEKGAIVNLTHSSGAAERFPALSPDGKSVAYFSDRSGEYELWVRPADGSGEERQITRMGKGFRYTPMWSPDSKGVVFIDQAMRILNCDVASGEVKEIDKGMWLTHGGLQSFRASWSSDSRWIAYVRDTANRNSVVMLHDTRSGKSHQVTSPFYGAESVAFDPNGKYLFLTTSQHFSPTYSDVDATWVYAGTTRLAAVPLTRDIPSPLAARSDVDKPEPKDKDEAKDKKNGKKEEKKDVAIDLEGFESRMVLLPPVAGYYADLAAGPGKVLYRRAIERPRGNGPAKYTLFYYDLEEREEKAVVAEADGFSLSTDGKKLLVSKQKALAVLDIKPDQKFDKQVPTKELPMTLDPRAEWRQIFNDAWRLERDFFYDPGMHGVDWKQMKARYGKLLEECSTREDVNWVIGELIAELNASHAYRGGGDLEHVPPTRTGLLGADYALENGAFRIKRILRGASWDAPAKAPLAQPGLNVQEGDYLLAVNRAPLDTTKTPWAAFAGLAGSTVVLTVNSKPSLDGAREILVETIPSEAQLRYQAWVEEKRAYVDKVSGGRIGYVYVPDTGINGQTELVRQFQGQWHKEGLIVDERFNSGGQIPDRFVELLGRRPLNYWGLRDGANWQSPAVAFNGSMAMLINGWSGSGGDLFPRFFKQAGLGPLIGRRTWGGLIGISGAPVLIDGGFVTVPTFGIFSKEGQWVVEGYGVDPDIEVIDDPALTATGRDPQLERAIQEVDASLKRNPPRPAPKPKYPDRSGRQ